MKTTTGYNEELDAARITKQIDLVRRLMADEQWRTLAEIAVETGAPEASASADLRYFRRRCAGAHTVNKRRRGPACGGLWEYQLVLRHEAGAFLL